MSPHSNSITPRLLPVVLFVLCMLCTGIARADSRGDWHMFHHDPQHTGRSPFAGPTNALDKWAFATGSDIETSPAIAADGTIYVGADDFSLYAINPDGTKKWSYPTGAVIWSSPALGADGTVYVGSQDGALYAINANGILKWTFATRAAIDSSPVLATDGTIYIGSENGNLYAVNPDGSQQWAFPTNGIYASPVLSADGTVFVGDEFGFLYAVNPDGTQKWVCVLSTSSGFISSPTVGADGTIYIGSDDYNVYAVTPDGTKKWLFHTQDIVESTPAVSADGTIYVGSFDNNLYALNPNGTRKWAFTAVGAGVASSPMVGADGTIYVGAQNTNLYAINPDGTQKWKMPHAIGYSSPALGADGTLYVGTQDGKLYALGQSQFALTKTASSSSVLVGDAVTYTLAATNNSQTAMTSVTLTDVLPAHLTYVPGSATGGGSYDAGTNTLIWTPGTLNAGVGATISFQATLNSGTPAWTTISNVASGSCAESTATVNSTTASITAALPAFSLQKTVSPAVALPGGKITYTLVATNTGNATATNLTITDPVPATLTYLAGSATGGGTYNSAASALTWVFGTLNAGATAVVSFQATVNAATAAGSYVVNTAAVSCLELPTAVRSNAAYCYVGVNAGAWWMFHHDAQHTGRTPFTGPALPAQKWSFATGLSINSSPAVGADGTVYVGSNDTNLYAINPDGSQKWAFPTGGNILSSPAISVDGTIYVGSFDRKLYAVNPDGSQKWSFATGGYLNSSPSIAPDGTIYVGSYDGELYAVNPDGAQKWAFATGGRISYSSPAVGADGTIYLGSYDHNLYAINPDGSKKWAFAATAYVYSSPAVGADGTVYVGSADHSLYAINPDGTQKWTYRTIGPVTSSPALGADGTIYVGSADANLYAFNPDGSLHWVFPTDGIILSSPTLGADGTVYVGCEDQNLYAVHPDGTQQWAFTTGYRITYSTPTLGADGTVYIGAQDGKLYAIGQAQFALQKTASPARVLIGNAVTYTLTASNSTSSALTNVTLTDVLPAGITYVPNSATGVNSYNTGTNTLTWTLGTLNAGAGAAVTFQATVNHDEQTGATIRNQASGSSAGGVIYSNAMTITVAAPALSMSKTVTPGFALPGNLVTYTLASNNYGNTTATNLTITDTLPPQLTYVAGSATGGGAYDSASRTLTWVFSAVRTSSTATATFQATVNAAAVLGSYIPNTAAVTCVELPTPLTGAASLCVGATLAGDWWMFHHDVKHTGRSPFTGPVMPVQKWAVAYGFTPQSSPALGADGTIFVGDDASGLYAFNPDGTRKWIASTSWGMNSSPAIDTNGTVYVGTNYVNLIYATNRDGTAKWGNSYGGNGGMDSSPALGTDGTIYLESEDGALFAINSDGTLKWSCKTGGGKSSPAIGADGTIYVGSADKNLYAINPDGSTKWTFLTGATVTSSPAIGTDGTIYVGSEDNNLYAVKPDGTQKWVFAAGNIIDSSPALAADGTIYVGSNDHNLYAVNPDGTKKWSFATGDIIYSSPAVGGDGTIYVGSFDKNLYAVNADGTKKWVFPTSGAIQTSPALGFDGTLYVGANDGKLYAVGTKPPLTVLKSVSSRAAKPGDTVTYTLMVTNNGYCTATNATLTDVVPAPLTYVAGSATGGGSYDSATNTLTWNLGTLNTISSATVSFQVTVNAAATAIAGTYVRNVAMISCVEMPTAVPSNAVVLYIGASNAGDWWVFHHDAQHTGRSAFTGPAVPGQKWSVALATYYDSTLSGHSSPALGADGTVYIGSYDHNLYAINPNGSIKWSYKTGGAIYSSPAIGTDGTIYVGSNDREFYAINPNGTLKWAFYDSYTVGMIESSPTIGVDGTIYVGGNEGNLYAFNPDGSWKWAFNAGFMMPPSSPALGADGTIYFGAGNSVYAVNPDGSQKWLLNTGSYIGNSPAVGTDGTIYVGSGGNCLYAIKPDGTPKWTSAASITSPAIGADGTIYTGSTAINADGTRKWYCPCGGYYGIYAPTTIGADGTVYIGSSNGGLYAIQTNGSIKWSFPTGYYIDSAPAIGADGTIYVSSMDGYLYAIGAPNLTLAKTVSTPTGKPTANAGETISYTLSYANTGNASATNMTLTDVLPVGISYLLGSASGSSSFNTATNTLSWTLGALNVGATAQVTFQATVNAGIMGGTSIANTAAIACIEDATPVVSNAATFTVTAVTSSQPDLTICNYPDNLYLGAGVFSSDGAGETKSQTTTGGVTAHYFFQVKNSGTTADSFLLTCPAPGAGWKTQFVDWATGKDITAAITGAGWKSAALTPGATTGYTVHVTPASTVVAGAVSALTVTAISAEDRTKADAVKAVTTLKAGLQPDLEICNYPDNVYLGLGVLNLDGANQTKSQTAANNATIHYFIQVKNAGNTTDGFTLTCPASSLASGWKAQFVDWNTGKDITAAITGAGWKTTAVKPGALTGYTIHLTPNNTLLGGAVSVLTVTAVSALDGTKKDAVKAVTTVAASYQPDLEICAYPNNVYLGLGILNADGTNQTKSSTTASGTMMSYFFQVKNAGNTTDTYTLTCPLAVISGWKVQFVDWSTGKDITAAITGKGTPTAAVKPGALAGFTIHLTPGAAAASNVAYPLLVTATSAMNKTKQDAVKAVTTKQ